MVVIAEFDVDALTVFVLYVLFESVLCLVLYYSLECKW